MFRRIFHFPELSETVETEKGSRGELLSCGLFHGMGLLEPLLLSVLESMDELCRGIICGIDKCVLVGLVGLLYTKGAK